MNEDQLEFHLEYDGDEGTIIDLLMLILVVPFVWGLMVIYAPFAIVKSLVRRVK